MRPVNPRLRSLLKTALGAVICAWSAALTCILLHGREVGAALPVAFLAIVVLVAIRFGTAAGVLGTAVSAILFAIFLYRPMGALSVNSTAARTNLAWLVLGGLACSYLIAPVGSERERHQ
jgi:K+-sensing histidine kinase KdpD